MAFRFACIFVVSFLLSAEPSPPTPDVGTVWGADWSAKNLDHVLTLYAQDAVFFTTDGGRFAGLPAIRELFQRTLATNSPTIQMHRAATAQSGKLAYESGDYKETIVAGGHSTHLQGHYLLVLRNQGGRWLIAEQMWTGTATAPSR